jgi:hypothetical protein
MSTLDLINAAGRVIVRILETPIALPPAWMVLFAVAWMLAAITLAKSRK